MLFVLVIAAEPKKATVAAEPVVLDTAEATAKVVHQLLQAKAPVAVDFEGVDLCRRQHNGRGDRREPSLPPRAARVPRGRHDDARRARLQRCPRAAAQLLVLLVLLPPVVAQGARQTRAPPPRARAREGEPEDRERLGGHRALRI